MRKNKSSEIFFLKEQLLIAQALPSSNTYLSDLNTEKDVLLFVHDQISGKGQRGNSWQSRDSENICCSVCLTELNIEIKDQFSLSKAVALSVYELLLPYLDPEKLCVKWPNDIYIGQKKVAGILIENMCFGNKIQKTIIGLGININQEEFEDLPYASSLKIETKVSYNLFSFLYPLFSLLKAKVKRLEANVNVWDKEYEEKLYRQGVWAFYQYHGQRIEALMVGVNEYGHLCLKTRDGLKLCCDIKEIRFVE